MMDARILASKIDHTLLRPDATTREIERLCREATENFFVSVCINPCHVQQCAEILRGTSIKVCSVVGFPLGATTSDIKMMETMAVLDAGASEIDMVINISAAKSGIWNLVEEEVSVISKTCRSSDALLKVIIETCLLSQEEKLRMCKIVTDTGAHFIKTSTGFSKSGATVADIKFLRANVGSHVHVKASGGIKTKEQALSMIEAGADRIGTSSGIEIVRSLS